MSISQVLVVGAGLMGASIGLALRDQHRNVSLADTDPAQLRLAADLGAGAPVSLQDRDAALGSAQDGYDVVMLCVPPHVVAQVLLHVQQLALGRTYSDVASVKANLLVEAEACGADLHRFVGGHPIAGRERAGPGQARADLFLGRPWVLTPTPAASPAAVEDVTELVQLCGASPVVLSADAHDAAMALVSHLPQTLASALASELADADRTAVELAGPGLRDLTRIADSDPELWGQIAARNGRHLVPLVRGFAARLAALADDLEQPVAAERFRDLVAGGNAGRSRLPGKHGGLPVDYVVVPVVIADEPGALARLLADAGEAGINVEDLSLEHSPGAPVGLCELLVRPAEAERLSAVLTRRGWSVHQHGAGSTRSGPRRQGPAGR